jgi:glycosyltransferase involved in cell wall biosynthesis
MKIVMFTPVSRASAIGRVALMVTNALSEAGHEVRVVRTDVDPPTESHRFGDVLAWEDHDAVVHAALAADVCVYQIGDHYPFHAGSLHWMPALRGIVCLHDQFVGHLFDAWAAVNQYDPSSTVRAWYGDDIAMRVGATPWNLDLGERARVAPMTEWISSQAIGVLTHSRWVLDRVVTSCPGPVAYAPLPYELRRVPIEPSRAHAGRFRLVTVGHMNPNKRVTSVIRAIGSDPYLRERVVYMLLGPISETTADAAVALAHELGVHLDVRGQVTDQVLAGALVEAHAIAALRWPCLEAASASAIEAMLSGKPTLVMRGGFYDELPDDCVIKIDRAREEEAIADALRLLVDDPSRRLEIGERAREYALSTHRSEPYAQALVELARSALAVAAPIEVVRSLVRQLEDWGGESAIGEDFIFGPLRELWKSAPLGRSLDDPDQRDQPAVPAQHR